MLRRGWIDLQPASHAAPAVSALIHEALRRSVQGHEGRESLFDEAVAVVKSQYPAKIVTGLP